MCISSFYSVQLQKSTKTYSYLSVFWIEQHDIWKEWSWGSWLKKSLVVIMKIKTILPFLFCSETKLPSWSMKNAQTSYFFRSAPRFVHHYSLKAEKKASLKSGISLQQRHNSRQNTFVMLPIIVYLVYHHQKISAIELILFWSWKWRQENALHNMASLSSYLARRVRKMTGILSSDWWRERAVRVCQVMCPPGIARF